MNDSVFRISLDIHEHGSQAVVKAKYADSGRSLHISLREGSIPYTIAEGCTAAFKATKPDGNHLFNYCDIKDNEIVYDFTEQTCTSAGTCRCEIVLYGSDGKVITSPRFLLLVDTQVYPDSVVESTSEFTALSALIVGTVKATDSANDAALAANAVAQDLLDSKNAGEFKGDKGDKGDPGIVNIDDTKVGTDAWSSKHIVDKLCPAFKYTGTLVTCEPVEGYPLTVTGGDVIARCGKNLYDESNTVKAEKIYADSNDTNGEIRFGVVVNLPKGKYTIHAERTATEGYSNDYIYVVVLDRWESINLSTLSVKPVQKGNTYAVQVELANNQCILFYNGLTTKATLDNTAELFGRYRLQIEVGAVTTPWEPHKGITTFNGDELIPALAGVNTLWHDIGDNTITVTGRADLYAIISKLTNALVSLGNNI